MGIFKFRHSAPLREIFLSQTIDHLVGLALGSFMMLSGLTLLDLPPGALARAGIYFWTGVFLTLLFSAVVSRFVCLWLFGATAGNLARGVRPSVPPTDPSLWVGQVLESFQVVFPALWMVELISRITHSRFPRLRYIFPRSP